MPDELPASAQEVTGGYLPELWDAYLEQIEKAHGLPAGTLRTLARQKDAPVHALNPLGVLSKEGPMARFNSFDEAQNAIGQEAKNLLKVRTLSRTPVQAQVDTLPETAASAAQPPPGAALIDPITREEMNSAHAKARATFADPEEAFHAGVNDILTTHSQRLEPNDFRVARRINPDTGSDRLVGAYIVPGDPVGAAMTRSLDPEDKAKLPWLSQAILAGRALQFLYGSAEQEDPEQRATAESRRAEYSASSAAQRIAGETAQQKSKITMIPEQLVATQPKWDKKEGRPKPSAILAEGFASDKALNNSEHIFNAAQQVGKELPYSGRNDPNYLPAFVHYIENQAHGYRGDGSGPDLDESGQPNQIWLKDQQRPGPQYVPHLLTRPQAEFIHASLNILPGKKVGSESGAPSFAEHAKWLQRVNRAYAGHDPGQNALLDELDRKMPQVPQRRWNKKKEQFEHTGKMLSWRKGTLEATWRAHRIELMEHPEAGARAMRETAAPEAAFSQAPHYRRTTAEFENPPSEGEVGSYAPDDPLRPVKKQKSKIVPMPGLHKAEHPFYSEPYSLPSQEQIEAKPPYHFETTFNPNPPPFPSTEWNQPPTPGKITNLPPPLPKGFERTSGPPKGTPVPHPEAEAIGKLPVNPAEGRKRFTEHVAKYGVPLVPPTPISEDPSMGAPLGEGGGKPKRPKYKYDYEPDEWDPSLGFYVTQNGRRIGHFDSEARAATVHRALERGELVPHPTLANRYQRAVAKKNMDWETIHEQNALFEEKRRRRKTRKSAAEEAAKEEEEGKELKAAWDQWDQGSEATDQIFHELGHQYEREIGPLPEGEAMEDPFGQEGRLYDYQDRPSEEKPFYDFESEGWNPHKGQSKEEEGEEWKDEKKSFLEQGEEWKNPPSEGEVGSYAPVNAGPEQSGLLSDFEPGEEGGGTGMMMASPSIREGMKLAGAKKALGSDVHAGYRDFVNRTEAAAAAQHQTPQADVRDALGSWTDGAENSLRSVHGEQPVDTRRVVAALSGLHSAQKNVLNFRYDPDGPHQMYHVGFNYDSPDKVSKLLDQHGISFRTLEGGKGQPVWAHIVDKEKSAGTLDALEKLFEGKHINQIYRRLGHAEMLGDPNETSREDAATAFRRVLQEARDQDAQRQGRGDASSEPWFADLWREAEENFQKLRASDEYEKQQVAQDYKQSAADLNDIPPEQQAKLAEYQRRAQAWIANEGKKWEEANPQWHRQTMYGYLLGKNNFPIDPETGEPRINMTKADIAEHVERLHKKLDFSKPSHREKAAEMMLYDMMHSLAGSFRGDPSAAYGWYDRAVSKTFDKMSEVAPLIKKDPLHNLAFRLGLAITSQGQKVPENAESSWHSYNYWQQHQNDARPFPESNEHIGAGGKEIGQIENNFRKVNDLWEKYGPEAVNEILTSKMSVKKLKEKYDLDVSGEKAAYEVRGAMGLGPKIGAFFSNLSGIFDPVTMDRWFARQMNFYGGDMFGFSETPMKEGTKDYEPHLDDLEKLLDSPEAMKSAGPEEIKKMRAEVAKLRAVPEGKMTRNKAKKLAPEIHDWAKRATGVYSRSYAGQEDKPQRSWHPDFDTPENGLAKRMHENVTDLADAPRNSGERDAFRNIVGERLEPMLKAHGIHLTNADKQAVPWFDIKDVFRLAGSNALTNVNYLDAAYTLVRRIKQGLVPNLLEPEAKAA